MDQSKLDFIYQELSEWAQVVDSRLRQQFAKRNIGVTDELIRSLHYEVFQSSAGNDGEFRLSFLEYGRMLDMGVGRTGSQSISSNRNKYLKSGAHKIRKPKKWYSPTAYGSLNRLIGTLVNGYVEATMGSIKTNISGEHQ